MFSRTPPPTRSSGDRRRGLTYVIAAIAAIYLVLTALGTLWTDYLWFDSVGYGAVWTRRWTMSIVLSVAGIVVAFLVFWGTLVLAERLGPRYPLLDMGEEEELVVRFRQWVDGRARLIRVLVAAGLGLFVGLGVAAWRDDFFLFMERRSFDLADPIFGIDVGFFVFQFPLVDMALQWLFNLVAMATVLAAVAHYFNGGIRIRRGSFPSVARGAKVHVSVMLAILALIRAAMYRMDALGLLFAGRQEPSFFGPGYTDVTARLPALRLLMAIAVIAAVVFVANIWRRGWTLVVVSVGAWVLVSVAASIVYPAIIDRLQVQPQPLARESDYIANNIQFTREAFGLSDVEVREYPSSRQLTGEDIEANRLTVDNLRLWDASVLPRTYQNLQAIRPYYALDRVDTDRYEIEGEPVQTMVAVRELDEGNIPRTDWQNTRLIYTHGIGSVVSQANEVQADGQPSFLLSDLPPEAEAERLVMEQPRVYFGESYEAGRPVIVKTGSGPQEVDLPLQDEGIQNNEYGGDAGVDVGSIWRRIAFAFRYRDLNLLISGQLNPDSRVLVERNIDAMVSRVAPFLEADADPYPVVAEGRIYWVIDMYTSSEHFPYSRPITPESRARLKETTDLQSGINYLSNSVKAVVDAYDGTVDFYVTDESDPVVSSWTETYPDLFTDGSEMPEELKDHLRYPQDLFRIQGELYLEYHVDSPEAFFTGNDAWSIPEDPATIRRADLEGIDLLVGDGAAGVGGEQAYLREMLPYYLLTRLPGEDELSYVLLQPFNPRDKPNMSSFLVADAPSPEERGRLVDFRMPQGILVGGTGQVGQRIAQDDEIAEQFTLWGQQGSQVIRGDLLVVPIEESIMYVQPIYLQSDEAGGFPEFRRVVVVFGDRIEWAETLDLALAEVFEGYEVDPSQQVDVDPSEDPEEPSDGTLPESVQQLIDEAAGLLEDANSALQEGNLGEYQRLVDEAAQVLQEAREAAGEDVSALLP